MADPLGSGRVSRSSFATLGRRVGWSRDHEGGSAEIVADALDRARNELLDAGLRNPLINYRELRGDLQGVRLLRPLRLGW